MFKGKLEKIYLQWSHLKYINSVRIFLNNILAPKKGEYFKIADISKLFLHLAILHFM